MFDTTPPGRPRTTITVLVSATFPLDDVVEAHRQIDSGHTVGKIVLVT